MTNIYLGQCEAVLHHLIVMNLCISEHTDLFSYLNYEMTMEFVMPRK